LLLIIYNKHLTEKRERVVLEDRLLKLQRLKCSVCPLHRLKYEYKFNKTTTPTYRPFIGVVDRQVSECVRYRPHNVLLIYSEEIAEWR